MGCAPSAELLGDAPFRPPQGGVRQVALIPIVEQYFPTPDCALFKQLYEAYTDPSVRYYVRPNFDGPNGDLSRIPDVVNSRAELHQVLLKLTGQGMFATNAEVRAVYATGEVYRIRPILCAVVFLYEGANYVPEGSVQLPTHGRGPSVFVKVIGVVGDTTTMLRKAGDPTIYFGARDTLKMQTLITKSAGDHNMSRVVLLASYIYYHQCCEVIGLPKVPSMAACFTCFKTNIPFLCFLREMRDRTASVLEAPKDSKFYIDEHCLHGRVTQEYVDIMMPAFAYYFVSFLNAKSEQRVVKQLAHQQRASDTLKDGSQDSRNASSSVLPIGSNNSMPNSEGAQHSETLKEADRLDWLKISLAASSAAKADAAADSGNNVAPKVTYIVKGYLTRPATTLSAWSCAQNEVYVSCMDGTVTVVERRSVDAPDGPTHSPSLGQKGGVEEVAAERGMPTSAFPVVETFRVCRGDILSFYTPSSSLDKDAAAEAGGYDEGFENESMTSSNVNLLRLNTDDDSAVPSPSMPSLTKEGKDTLEWRKGSWQVDDSIFIESVLLSLVRDECKLAREASVDDPRWVHDDVRDCPVHDGPFYVWHFRRGQENFFYGTVPKFANTNRTQGRGGGAAGTRALRSSGVRVSKSGMAMEPHAGNPNGTHGNASAMKKPDLRSGSNGVGRPQVDRTTMLQQQRTGLPTVYRQYGSMTDSTHQRQQSQPPSYIDSRGNALANTNLGVGSAFPGSGLVYLFPNSGVSATGAARQLLCNVPYPLPGQSPSLSMQPQAAPGVPASACAMGQPSQSQGSGWLAMGSAGAAGPVGRGLGDSVRAASISGSGNVASTGNSATAVPYVLNAQGQLVPLTSVPMDKSHQNATHATASTPPAPMAGQTSSYVVVNGQLCLLQPATAASLPSPYLMTTQPPNTPPQQTFVNNNNIFLPR